MKMVPSRTSGVPVIRNRKAETSAEPLTEAISKACTMASGGGTRKTRNAIGNAADHIHLAPMNRKPPATMRLT
jgi:hypothetical protein